MSPGMDHIPAELIQAGGRAVCFEIHTLILFGIKNNFLSSGSHSLYPFKIRMIKQAVIIIEAYHLSTAYEI
jgi:hypothetical protein